MNTVLEMKQFGITLTDRADGKKAWKQISESSVPEMLDFQGVMALGSSFGDEVLPNVAKYHQGIIRIVNANKAIQSCISKIEEDFKFIVKYE